MRKRSCSSAAHFSRGIVILYGFRGFLFPAGIPVEFLADDDDAIIVIDFWPSCMHTHKQTRKWIGQMRSTQSTHARTYVRITVRMS